MIFAASGEPAPIKFAILEDAAIDMAKGTCHDTVFSEAMMPHAARCPVPKVLQSNVMTSKARNSASTMIMLGRASFIMGFQLARARMLSPPQHCDPLMNLIYSTRNKGSRFRVTMTATGAPMKPMLNCEIRSQLMKMLTGAASNRMYVVARNRPCAWRSRFPVSNTITPGIEKIITRRYFAVKWADRGFVTTNPRRGSENSQSIAMGIERHRHRRVTRWH